MPRRCDVCKNKLYPDDLPKDLCQGCNNCCCTCDKEKENFRTLFLKGLEDEEIMRKLGEFARNEIRSRLRTPR